MNQPWAYVEEREGPVPVPLLEARDSMVPEQQPASCPDADSLWALPPLRQHRAVAQCMKEQPVDTDSMGL